MKGTPSQRFWAKVEEDASTGCWLWMASKAKGYGSFFVSPGAPKVSAHRWAYEALIAPIPPGLVLDHLCRTPACVNPWHLDPVPTLVNNRRGIGHGSETACPQGHAYDEANTYTAPRGDRQCRECMRARNRRYMAARRAA